MCIVRRDQNSYNINCCGIFNLTGNYRDRGFLVRHGLKRNRIFHPINLKKNVK